MKTRNIADIFRDKGMERGTLHVLEMQQEQLNTLQRSIRELAAMQDQIITSLQNVVAGTTGMRHEMMKRLKQAGLAMPDDDLDPNTHSLGN